MIVSFVVVPFLFLFFFSSLLFNLIFVFSFLTASLKAGSFISDIGGSMGLWVGVSILTVAEVIELLGMLCFHLLKRVKSRNGDVNRINAISMQQTGDSA